MSVFPDDLKKKKNRYDKYHFFFLAYKIFGVVSRVSVFEVIPL